VDRAKVGKQKERTAMTFHKRASHWVLSSYACGDWAIKLVYRLSGDTYYRRHLRVELGAML
jgi:hypothetical protein